jgi:hypothetical protein
VNRLLVALVIGLAFTGLACWLLHPLATSPATTLYDSASFQGAQVGQADVTLNAWILSWGAHALSTGRFAGFFDANIFYPEPATLAYSEHLLGVAPFFAPIYWATGNPALALNLWTVASFALCALTMYWVGLRWLQSHAAAAVAAFAYAFAPARFFALTHVQVLGAQYLPLLAYAIWATRRRRDRATWLAIFALAGLQALSSYYLGYLGFVVAGAMALASLPGGSESRASRALFVASALAAAALLMLPLSLPYLELSEAGRLESPGVVFAPWHYLRAQLFPPIPAPGPESWALWEAIPWLALAGAALGLASARYRALSAALAGLALLGAVLAMGPQLSILGVKLGAIHELAARSVPGWSSLRVYGRFSIASWLALSLLAALPFARGVRWLTPHAIPLRVLAGLLVAGLAGSASRIEIRTLPAPDTVRDLTPYRWLAQHGEGDPVLEWPMQFGLVDSEYMYLSRLHWLPMVNGYSGHRAPSNALMGALAASLPEPEAARSLVQLNAVRWLVVHTDRRGWGTRNWQRLAEVGAELRGSGAHLRIYELPFQRERPSPLTRAADAETSIFGTPKRPLSSRDLQAEITPLDPELESTGRNRWVALRVRNASSVPWPALGREREGLVGLSFRSRPVDTERYAPLRGFARLPADLEPGASAALQARLYPPRQRGDYELLPCLMQWGGTALRCFPEARITLRVRPPGPGG